MAAPRRPQPELAEGAIAGYAIGGLAPIVVAGALVAVRDDIEHTTAVLVLVVVVVLAAAAGGRGAGALAALVAALSFDFFLTRPYLSMEIESKDDIETTLGLLVIGLIVGQIVVLARRSRREAERAADDLARLRRVARQAASGAGAEALVATVEAELTGLLSLFRCRFQAEPLEFELPRLDRSGALETSQHLLARNGAPALPEAGVELLVLGGGREVGRFVLDGKPDVGVSLAARVVAVALADQLGAALASSHTGGASRDDPPGS